VRVKRAGEVLVTAWLVRKLRRRYLAKKRAVVAIQAGWRQYCAWSAIADACRAQVRISRWWTTLKATLATRRNFLESFAHVKVIQRMLKRAAAARIQALVRGVSARSSIRFRLSRTAVIILQKNLRAWRVRQEMRRRQKELEGAVLVVQSFFVKYKMRQMQAKFSSLATAAKVEAEKNPEVAATTIQSKARQRKSRKDVADKRRTRAGEAAAADAAAAAEAAPDAAADAAAEAATAPDTS
jgi:Fe-S oxidoreductase